MSDDAEFEAFLKGEGELSRRLQALDQPSPSADLDAAILGRIRTSMEQQQREAANDPGAPASGPRIAPVMGMRWRVPVGIAASVLVGLFATQAYQSNTSSDLVTVREQERAADAVMKEEQAAVPPPAAAEEKRAAAIAPAADAANEAVPAPVVQAVPAVPAAPAEAPAAGAVSAETHKPALQRRSARYAARPVPSVEATPAPAVIAAQDSAAPAPPPPFSFSAPPAAAPAPAPVAASQAASQAEAGRLSSAAAAASRSREPIVNHFKAAAPAPMPSAPSVLERVEVTGSRMPPARIAEGPSPIMVLKDQRVEITGSSIGRSGVRQAPDLEAAAWVEAIEQLLDKGDIAGAVREWKKLRLAYPGYKAPAKLEARMKALLELNS